MLVYARSARCPCGAGLAYEKNSGPHGSWDCSAILLGTAVPSGKPGSVQHTAVLPFVFYEVKVEREGISTRPTD